MGSTWIISTMEGDIITHYHDRINMLINSQWNTFNHNHNGISNHMFKACELGFRMYLSKFGIFATLPRWGRDLSLEHQNLGGAFALGLDSSSICCSDHRLGMIGTQETSKGLNYSHGSWTVWTWIERKPGGVLETTLELGSK